MELLKNSVQLTENFGLEKTHGFLEPTSMIAQLMGVDVHVKPPLEPSGERAHLPKVRSFAQCLGDVLDRQLI